MWQRSIRISLQTKPAESKHETFLFFLWLKAKRKKKKKKKKKKTSHASFMPASGATQGTLSITAVKSHKINNGLQ